MALYRCIRDNSYDNIQGYRKGQVYEKPLNPDTNLFTLISAAQADSMTTDWTPLPARRDLQGDWHVDNNVEFESDVSFAGDVLFDNITGDAGIQKFVAWNSGTGIVDITLPGMTKTDDTEFTIHAGSANFLDLSDPINPTISHIHWDDITGITDTFAATNLRTAVSIDSDGNPELFADEMTAAQRRTNVFVGLLTHTDGSTITQVNLIPQISTNPIGKIHDVCAAIKFANLSGNVYSGASSSVNSLAVTAGSTFSCDRNFADDKDSPNVTIQAADADISTFFTAYQDGAGGQTIGAASVVDTTKWDDATGSIATIDDGFWVTHRLYRSTTSGSTLLVYGQEQHRGRTEALNSIHNELFAPLPGASELILRGFITIIKGATGLQDASSAVFTPADKWGEGLSNRDSNGFSTGTPSFKDYSFTSRGVTAGTYYVGGYYLAPSTDANLTQASTTVSYGTANSSYAAHPFIVAGGAGTVDVGTVGLRANFTRIQDDGTRTTSYTEVITADITTLSLNDYIEVGKCIGPVEYELYVVDGSPTTYSLDFNYGLAKYEDFGNRNFMVTDFEVTGIGGATDTNAAIALLHHTNSGWTYSAAAFTPGNGSIVNMVTDHSTDDNIINSEPFAYKRANIDFPVAAAGPNGIIVEIVAGQNNTYQILNAHIGVEF